MKSPEKNIKTGIVNMFYRLKDVKRNTYMLTEVWKTKKEPNWTSKYENIISEMETKKDGVGN